MLIQSIRFEFSPKLHPMHSPQLFPVDSQVVVQSRRGLEIARVRSDHQENLEQVAKNGHILHLASPQELQTWQDLQTQASDLKWLLRSKSRARKLPVKIVHLEFTLDAHLLTIYYSAEERIELSTLIGDLRPLTTAKVNFFAVGPREQAQTLGTLGACGRESCSSTHLQDFAPVSIRMARDQQLPLNPEKLSGPCGRLLCCLQYEHNQYEELLAHMPRKGHKACHTASGACGKVVKLNPLRDTIEIHTETGLLEDKTSAFTRIVGENRQNPKEK